MSTDHHAGPMPAKSTTTFTIQWGIVNIPVGVYAGQDKGVAVTRNEFTTDDHPVGRQPYDKTTGAVVNSDSIVKKVSVGDGYVELTDEEIELVTGGVEKGITDIIGFIPLETIGTTYMVTSVNQVRPQKGVKGADKPFALLCTAMEHRKVAALVRIALKSVAKYAAITPDGRFLQLAYNDQVRPSLPMPEVDLSDREIAMADALIDALGVETPVLVNDTALLVREYVEAKAAGGDVVEAVEAPKPVVEAESIESLLAAAVEAARAKKAEAAETKAA